MSSFPASRTKTRRPAPISPLENVLGPLWVWLAGVERPSAATLAGGIVVIGAVRRGVGIRRLPDRAGR